MKRFPYVLLLASIMLTSCGSLGAISPADTAVPPSDTPAPVPTSTPLPTDTATPVPTATQDAAATAAAQATAGAESVLSELDKVLGESDIPYKDGHLVWQQTEPLAINMQGPANKYEELDGDLTAGNFILKSEVTWTASGLLFCGAIFRSEPDIARGKQYQFLYLRLSGAPAWAIEVHNFGRAQNSPSGVKFSDALDLGNGATNQFILIANDNEFTLFINNMRQGRFYDNSSQRSEGMFAFFGLQDSGQGSCEFNNSWVWSLDQ
jgi:hypothetical protein